MKLLLVIKKELSSWNWFEKTVFPFIIFTVVLISFLAGDSKIALFSALCGISYTILAGKGKIYCYFIGLMGTGCYSYMAFINSFFGNFLLNILYYFPMQVLGVFKWKNHLKKESNEIYKTSLSKKERRLYFALGVVLSLFISFLLSFTGDITPFKDGFSTGLSIIGQILTVKRCIEQWYFWFMVNLLSFVMWIHAWETGAKAAAYIFMWGLYLFLSVYFYIKWRNEIISLKKD